MMGFVIAATFVAVGFSLIWLTVEAVKGNIAAGAAALVLLVIVLGVAINEDKKQNEKGPCHQYETRMMYNSATKTMMPSRVCVLQGEWVENER